MATQEPEIASAARSNLQSRRIATLAMSTIPIFIGEIIQGQTIEVFTLGFSVELPDPDRYSRVRPGGMTV